MTKRARTAIAFVIGLGWLAALATAAGAEVHLSNALATRRAVALLRGQ